MTANLKQSRAENMINSDVIPRLYKPKRAVPNRLFSCSTAANRAVRPVLQMASEERSKRGEQSNELDMNILTLMTEFKMLHEEVQVQAMKEAQSSAAHSSSDAAAGPKKGKTKKTTAPYRGKESRKRCLEDSSSEDKVEAAILDDDDMAVIELSEAMGAFVEAAFRKLDNAQRKKKLNKYGTPDSRWLRCPKLDPVVSANVSREATKADRSSSRLHQFLLDPVSPLVSTLELAESGDLTPEAAIANTQAALVLLGNASQHFATERRKVLLQQLNPKLKALVEDSDFSDAPPLFLGLILAK